MAIVRRQVDKGVGEILAKDTCDVWWGDIVEALNLMADAQSIGDLELNDKLHEWVREAYRSYVPEATAANSQTMADTMSDADWAHVDRSNAREIVYSSWPSQQKRGFLSALAQGLGMPNLAVEIREGNYIQPSCVQFWNITAEAYFDEYSYYGERDSWKAVYTLNDVPIYIWDVDMNLPPLTHNLSVAASIKDVKQIIFEALDSPRYHGKMKGNHQLIINIRQDTLKDDVWVQPIYITAMTDDDYPNQVTIQFPEQQWTDDGMYPYPFLPELQKPIEVPLRLLWNRQYFVFEKYMSGAPEEYDSKEKSIDNSNFADVPSNTSDAFDDINSEVEYGSEGGDGNEDGWINESGVSSVWGRWRGPLGENKEDNYDDVIAWKFEFGPSKRISIEEYKKMYLDMKEPGISTVMKNIMNFIGVTIHLGD